MADILERIIERRRSDLARLGPAFGASIPASRSRPLMPFMASPGVVLEIKRASPSKGDIDFISDPSSLALQYRASGASAISILTEHSFFKGSLDDLLVVGQCVADVALLRKDFILDEAEIDVSYRAGADAVLLIARILEEPLLFACAARCHHLGMTAFVEIRDQSDVDKFQRLRAQVPAVAGVNSRDLRSFRTDPLVPVAFRSRIDAPVVFESGLSSPSACAYARRMGFHGLLIGEAAVRSPEGAASLVQAFASARLAPRTTRFWERIATAALLADEEPSTGVEVPMHQSPPMGPMAPMVKVCGLTRVEDALLATASGASMLGFVLADSTKEVSGDIVRSIVGAVRSYVATTDLHMPLCIAVIAQSGGSRFETACSLVIEGTLDAIQYHGDDVFAGLHAIDDREVPGTALSTGTALSSDIPRYAAVGIASSEDLELLAALKSAGEPRVLADARHNGRSGGTGRRIDDALLAALANQGPLWLAGGLSPETLANVLDRWQPELIDLSGGLESAPGIKDHRAIEDLFALLGKRHSTGPTGQPQPPKVGVGELSQGNPDSFSGQCKGQMIAYCAPQEVR